MDFGVSGAPGINPHRYRGRTVLTMQTLQARREGEDR